MTQTNNNSPKKTDANDTFGSRVFVWVFILGFVGYIIGAGYGGYTEDESIGGAILWIILMVIAPLIIIPVIKAHGFAIVLVVVGMVSIMSGDNSSVFGPAVGYAFIGAVIGGFIGGALGSIFEGFKYILHGGEK